MYSIPRENNQCLCTSRLTASATPDPKFTSPSDRSRLSEAELFERLRANSLYFKVLDVDYNCYLVV